MAKKLVDVGIMSIKEKNTEWEKFKGSYEFLLESPGDFEKWANSFLLINQNHMLASKVLAKCKTLEEAKMKFSDEYQDLFEASHNLRKLKEFPVYDVCVPRDIQILDQEWFNPNFRDDGTIKVDWLGARILGHENSVLQNSLGYPITSKPNKEGVGVVENNYGITYGRNGSGLGAYFSESQNGVPTTFKSNKKGFTFGPTFLKDFGWVTPFQYGLHYDDGSGRGEEI